MEDLGIPDLTSEQTEKLCAIAEESTRKYLLAKVRKKDLEKLNVTSEVEGTRPIRLEISIDVGLLSKIKGLDVQEFANEAMKAGFMSAETYLRELACRSQK